MKNTDILTALGDVDERYIEEAAPKKRRSAWKWGTLAASILILCGLFVHFFHTPNFETFLALYEKGFYQEKGYHNYTLTLTLIPAQDRLAGYINVPRIKQDILKNYIGMPHYERENEIFYYIDGKTNLAYLISESKEDGELLLWRFDSFTGGLRNLDGTPNAWTMQYYAHLNLSLDNCTFDEIFRIYGLETIDDIEKITVSPLNARDSDTKELIWHDFEEKTLTDKASIQTVYEILANSLVYGQNDAPPVRFTYSFSDRNGGDPYPCGQCELTIELCDGTAINLVSYNANIGAFIHSGTCSVPLSENDVLTLNTFFGIS